MTKKKIWYVTAIALLAVAITGVSLGIYFARRNVYGKYAPYSVAQRDILKMRSLRPDFPVQTPPPKRVIDENHPLNLVTWYGGTDGIEALWAAIPEPLRSFSVLLLIPDSILKPGNDAAIERLHEAASACERQRIPFAIQHINGGTHAEWFVPLKYLEETYLQMEYCYGLSAAELYNAPVWRGNLDGDMSDYVADSIRLSAAYGGFMFWTDTNQFGVNGNIVDWIENNEYLYSTMAAYSEYIFMQNKESYGNPSTYSLMYGLYLAGLIGGWGVSTDF